MKYNDGSVYVGTWSKDKISGHGMLKIADKQYTGAWLQGKMHGFGELVQDNGMTYVGYFRNGMTNGKGRLIAKDGSYYEGDWLNDEKSGVGTRYYAKSGRVRKESWYKG